MSIAPDNFTHHSRVVFFWKISLGFMLLLLALLALSGALGLPLAGM